MGFKMHLLDLGGGFTGLFDAEGRVSEAPSNFGRVREALDEFFGHAPLKGCKSSTNPGRYFAQAPVTMACLVYGKREGINDEAASVTWTTTSPTVSTAPSTVSSLTWTCERYFLQPNKAPLANFDHDGFDGVKISSTVYGPTCDSLDCVMRNIPLPELSNGDWLMFPGAGAYTMAWLRRPDLNAFSAPSITPFT